eukprot:1724196-Heterocapsa_arctica.AAC.1
MLRFGMPSDTNGMSCVNEGGQLLQRGVGKDTARVRPTARTPCAPLPGLALGPPAPNPGATTSNSARVLEADP